MQEAVILPFDKKLPLDGKATQVDSNSVPITPADTEYSAPVWTSSDPTIVVIEKINFVGDNVGVPLKNGVVTLTATETTTDAAKKQTIIGTVVVTVEGFPTADSLDIKVVPV